MIYGNLRDEKLFGFLDERVKQCFSYLKQNDLSQLEPGRYEIDGEHIFVNIVEYETTQRENRFWEAHRQYLDLHVMISGAERIDLNLIHRMEQKVFVEKDDFLPLEGDEAGFIILSAGDFLICYPQDAHRTAVAAGTPQRIKKAIFKIKC